MYFLLLKIKHSLVLFTKKYVYIQKIKPNFSIDVFDRVSL